MNLWRFSGHDRLAHAERMACWWGRCRVSRTAGATVALAAAAMVASAGGLIIAAEIPRPPVERPAAAGDSVVGAGVVVSSAGHVLTGRRIVDGCESLRLSYANGRSGPARLVAEDAATGLALLQWKIEDMPFISLRAERPMRRGDDVYFADQPSGEGPSASPAAVIIGPAGDESETAGLLISSWPLPERPEFTQRKIGAPVRDRAGAIIGLVTDLFPRSVPRQPDETSHAAYVAPATTALLFAHSEISREMRQSSMRQESATFKAREDQVLQATVAVRCAVPEAEWRVGSGRGTPPSHGNSSSSSRDWPALAPGGRDPVGRSATPQLAAAENDF